MKNFLQYILPVFLLSAFVVNYVWEIPEFDTVDEEIEHYTATDDYQAQAKLYQRLIEKDSTNLDLHYKMISAHFRQGGNGFLWSTNTFRDDAAFFQYYKKFTNSDRAVIREVGHFGLGLIYYFLQLYDECFYELQKINAPHFKYKNYLLGNFYYYLDWQKSVQYFNQELQFYPKNVKAISRKANLFMQYQQLDSLELLLQDESAEPHVPFTEKRYTYFHTHSYYKYFQTLVMRVLLGANTIGFIGAILILVIWLIYLMIIRSKVKPQPLMIAGGILMGMIFAFGTSYLTDINKYWFGFGITGEWWQDLIYAIVGIGMVEETVKILPFLILLLFYKRIKEPIDYIFFAGISALGFAFVENIIYFDSSGIKTIQGRALTATVTHLFNTSLIAYGIVIGRFSKKKNTLLYFFLFFLLASFFHGFYDFWLISPDVKRFSFITFLWLLISMMIWASIINNCLNNSFRTQAYYKFKPVFTNNFLLFSLSFIFLFQYVFVGLKYGASIANYELQKDVASGLFLLIFLTINLSKFDYIPNYWAPLKLWDWDVFMNIPQVEPRYFNLAKILDQKVRLSSFGQNGTLHTQLPIEGRVVSRELLNWEKDWYLIELNRTIKVGLRTYDYLMVKTRYENELFLEKQHQIIKVRLVKKNTDLQARKKRKRDFLFIDLARVEKLS